MRKTVVFVTHDIDEAIKLGDRIAILREGGVLAQYATPSEILANPADEFVAEFVGADRALKRLGLTTLADVELAHATATGPRAIQLPVTTNVRDALSAVLAVGGAPLAVVDGDGEVVGLATLEAIGRVFGNGSDGMPSSGTHPEVKRESAAADRVRHRDPDVRHPASI